MLFVATYRPHANVTEESLNGSAAPADSDRARTLWVERQRRPPIPPIAPVTDVRKAAARCGRSENPKQGRPGRWRNPFDSAVRAEALLPSVAFLPR